MILNSIALFLLAIALLYFFMGFKALRSKQPGIASFHVIMSLACFALSGVLFLGFLSIRGYRTFVYEELAATIQIEPIEAGLFYAHFQYPNGTKHTYKIYGNELYVDAHILKWKPLANFFGIHTSYQLARVGGRYVTVMDEINQKRSIFPLTDETKIDLFKLRHRFSSLTFLVDAEYGSASFIPAKEANYSLKISNTGLMFRVDP